MRTLTRDQVRKIDRTAIEEYGVPSLVLMENAGRGATDVLCSLGIDGRVIICCGKGNNGGDGLVIARHLEIRGFEVAVLHWTDGDEWSHDARVQFEIVRKSGIPCERAPDQSALNSRLEGANWIVDAMLGTGATGEPRAPYDRVIEASNATSANRYAVDIPSGLDCDTGIPAKATFNADHTCTFVAAKRGLVGSQAQRFVGHLHVVDIGAPRQAVESVH